MTAVLKSLFRRKPRSSRKAARRAGLALPPAWVIAASAIAARHAPAAEA